MESAEIATSQQQAHLYGLLAGLLSAPPNAELVDAVWQMAAALEIDCPVGLAPGELHREFMELFRVPNPRYVAPYESVYRDRHVVDTGPDGKPLVVGRLLMGPSAHAVRQCFLDAGVLPAEDLPDHIGNELRLMSHLWANDNQELPTGKGSLRELRGKVRDDHLLKWIGDLRTKLLKHERLGFYSAALHLVEAVLEQDRSL
jgi:TorA maturation chaperone TorD